MSPTNVFVTGDHGLTLVRNIYHKGFVLNTLRCPLENKNFVWTFDILPEVTPYRKKKKIDLNLCIFCQSHNSSLEITKNILETSLVTLTDQCKKRRYYKDSKVTEFTDGIGNISVFGIIKQNGFYQRECYKTLSSLNEVKELQNVSIVSVMTNNLRKYC